MWNMVRHNSKSNSMYGPPKQIKAPTRLRSGGWRSTAGADLIVTKAFILLLVKAEEGTLRIFPCCSLSPGSHSLSSSSPWDQWRCWFHSSLHCHPEQINVTMRKARAALFLRRANSLLESLSDLLYSLSSPKNTLERARLPSLFWLGYGANYKLPQRSTALHSTLYSLTTYKLHNSCWLYFTCTRAFRDKP